MFVTSMSTFCKAVGIITTLALTAVLVTIAVVSTAAGLSSVLTSIAVFEASNLDVLVGTEFTWRFDLSDTGALSKNGCNDAYLAAFRCTGTGPSFIQSEWWHNTNMSVLSDGAKFDIKSGVVHEIVLSREDGDLVDSFWRRLVQELVVARALSVPGSYKRKIQLGALWIALMCAVFGPRRLRHALIALEELSDALHSYVEGCEDAVGSEGLFTDDDSSDAGDLAVCWARFFATVVSLRGEQYLDQPGYWSVYIGLPGAMRRRDSTLYYVGEPLVV